MFTGYKTNKKPAVTGAFGCGWIVLDDEVVAVLANEAMKTRIEFQEPRDRRMAHTTMSPTYRFGTRALEREGRKIDIQVTHEDQGHQGKY